MIVWRICRAAHADLLGEGARLYGGRWNTPGHPMIYTAEAAALAVLEVRVHLDLTPDLLPDDYLLIGIETGDTPPEMVPTIPDDPASFGDDWLATRRSALLRVPSVIVPESANLLINPRHPGAETLRIVGRRPFRFDDRLWRPLSFHQ